MISRDAFRNARWPAQRDAVDWKPDDENNRFPFGLGDVADSSRNYIDAIGGYDS